MYVKFNIFFTWKNIMFFFMLEVALLLAASVLVSCDGTEEVGNAPTDSPITFTFTEQEEQNVSRAVTKLDRGFVVWGYKSKTVGDSYSQQVFPGYSVNFLQNSAGTTSDNSHDYYYTNGADQTIKFWDYGVDEYNFWGYTGAKSDFSADGTQLTISGLEQSLTVPNVDNKLFSALYHREPVSNEVVRLEFKRPYALVRVMFYSGETLEAGDQVEITDVTFAPASPTKIVNSGTLTVSYPQEGKAPEVFTTSVQTTTAEPLAFEAITLDHTQGTSSSSAVLAVPVGGTEFYCTVPYIYPSSFTLTAVVEGEEKTASVPAEMMHWLPNYTYTYLFKILEAGKKIEFYDVKVDPWKYGGSQDDEWTNW